MSWPDFERIANALREPMLLVGSDGRVVAHNRAAAKRLTPARGQLVGCSLFDLLDGEPAALQEYLRRCSRTGEPQPGAARFLVDGEPYDVRMEGAVYRPRSGGSVALVSLRILERKHASAGFVTLNHQIEALSREVDRRKLAEETLRQQRELLHVTLSSIADAVVATDTDGRVIFMNRTAERLTGWSDEEARGLPGESVVRLFDDVGDPAAAGADAVGHDDFTVVLKAGYARLVDRHGGERIVRHWTAPITAPDAPALGEVVTFRDETRMRDLQSQLADRARELEESDRRKSEFIAMLAHELRNPLAPIQNGVALLGMKNDDARVVDYVSQVIDRQVRHMRRLVDDLVDVSRIERGSVKLQKSPGDLVGLVREVLGDFAQAFGESGIALAVELPREPLPMHADWSRLRQVVSNLVENALKYTDRGGSVSVRMEVDRHRGQATIEVADTGMGIAAEMLPRLFKPFSQAERAIDRSNGGLGLGLSVVKGLVELHEGEVDAFSAGPGQGARFTVRMKLEPARVSDVAEATPAREPTASLRILVIEDNADAAESLQRLLAALGHSVSVAASGPEGVEAARTLRPELILCDVGLPGMDGYAVARALRNAPETRDTRLIALTGYGQDEDRKMAIDAGFDLHLTKPVDPARLFAELHRTRKPA